MSSVAESVERPESIEAPSSPSLVWTTSESSRVGVEALRELWLYRDVVAALTLRYVRVKYAQAWLGIGWAALQPIVLAAIIAMLAARFDLGGEDFFLTVLLGMVVWSFFATAVDGASESLLDGRELLTKIYFPREAMPLAAVTAAGLDLLVSAVVVLGIVLVAGETPTASWLAIPSEFAVVTAAAAVAGLTASVVNAYYRDVRYALPFALQLGLFASAVFYPIDAFPHPEIYAIINPVAGAIDGIRDAVVGGSWPDPAVLLGQIAWLCLALVLSYRLFRRMAPTLVERM